MSRSTVKCNTCNVVINELLAFLRNVLDIMDEESVHQLCTSSFSAEEVQKAKTLLFESLPSGKKMPARRKDGKKRMSRDLDDMICLLKGSNPELFPIFVAKELHRVPPVSFDHVDVTRLLKDMVKLQNKVSLLEEKISTSVTMEQFDIIRQEVENMKHSSLIDNYTIDRNVNKRRGACLQNSATLDSGPIGLQYVPIKCLQLSADLNVNGRPEKNTSTTSDRCDNNCFSISQEQQRVTENHWRVDEQEGVRNLVSASEIENATSGEEPVLTTTSATSSKMSPTMGQNTSEISPITCKSKSSELGSSSVVARSENLGDEKVNSEPTVGNVYDTDSEWKVVMNKHPKQNKLCSQKGKAIIASEGKFRAADIKVPLLISNVSMDTSENDIISYIKDKTNEIVILKKINMRSARNYNAFKLFVSKNKVDMFLNDELWPDGIVFRRFVHFMYRTKPQELLVKV